jgi:hypothetical protein
MWNIHQDTPHSGLSNSTKFKRIKIIQSIISGYNKFDMMTERQDGGKGLPSQIIGRQR